jgi:Putative transmembrane protein (PGPGW)
MLEHAWGWVMSHGWLSFGLAIASLVMLVGSILVLPFLVARLPEDYFRDPQPYVGRLRQLHPLGHMALLVLKNLVGWVLVLAGIAMLLLPGQGVLTILVGLVLCDFPGKRALERGLAGRPAVLGALNWMRRRAGQGPLLAPSRRDGQRSAR